MKTITDIEKQLNLNPQVIYLLLSAEEINAKSGLLERINEQLKYTFGLFKFQVVDKDGPYSMAISSKLTRSIRGYNMLVRLVSNSNDGFLYAVGTAPLMESDRDFEITLTRFISYVCNKNGDLIEDYIYKEKEHLDLTFLKKQENLLYVFRKIRYLITTGKLIMPEQIHLKKEIVIKKVSDDKMVSHGYFYDFDLDKEKKKKSERPKISRPDFAKPPKLYCRVAPADFEKMVVEAKSGDDIDNLWMWVEQYYHTASKDDSDKIAKDIYSQKPAISVEIKKFEKENTQGRKSKVEKTEKKYKMLYGVIFRVNGEEYPIHFDTDQSMLYICTLLRMKMGEKLYIHEFRNNEKGKNSKYQKATSEKWLKQSYEIIFPEGERSQDFIYWIKKVAVDGQPLNQAKAQASKKITKLLPKETGADQYCRIQTELKKGDSYYYILLEPDEIIVPDEMKYLLNGVNCLNEQKE